MKVTVSCDTKYFCITESVALYLQKFILYRKRKVFMEPTAPIKACSTSSTNIKTTKNSFTPVPNHLTARSRTGSKSNNCGYATPVLYRIISNDVRDVVARNYDIICFFTPVRKAC